MSGFTASIHFQYPFWGYGPFGAKPAIVGQRWGTIWVGGRSVAGQIHYSFSNFVKKLTWSKSVLRYHTYSVHVLLDAEKSLWFNVSQDFLKYFLTANKSCCSPSTNLTHRRRFLKLCVGQLCRHKSHREQECTFSLIPFGGTWSSSYFQFKRWEKSLRNPICRRGLAAQATTAGKPNELCGKRWKEMSFMAEIMYVCDSGGGQVPIVWFYFRTKLSFFLKACTISEVVHQNCVPYL